MGVTTRWRRFGRVSANWGMAFVCLNWPRSDFCVRLAQLAELFVGSLEGSDTYRVNGLAETVEGRQMATFLQYVSTSHSDSSTRGDVAREMRTRGEKAHGGMVTLARRSAAAYGEPSAEGSCRSGYVIGLVSSTPKDPSHILQ